MIIKKLSPFRSLVYHISKRNDTKHASVSLGFAWDISDALSCIELLQKKGEQVTLTAFMTKATALLMKKHPQLNSKIYKSLFLGIRVVQYSDIHCSMLVETFDEQKKSEISFSVLKNVDKMSIVEISRKIKKQKRSTYKTKKIFPLLLKFIQFRLSHDPIADSASLGTYAMSSMILNNSGASGGYGLSPYLTYWLLSIEDKIVPYNGKMKLRKILGFGLGFDHYLLDIGKVTQAMADLKKIVEEPQQIFLDEFPHLSSLIKSNSGRL